jgi:hypothetical protein
MDFDEARDPLLGQCGQGAPARASVPGWRFRPDGRRSAVGGHTTPLDTSGTRRSRFRETRNGAAGIIALSVPQEHHPRIRWPGGCDDHAKLWFDPFVLFSAAEVDQFS